ncbi:hypothetical protein GCM10010912_56300 [Paenibacillus albidus]|uniref:Uncharacterized protein n=1 Tax=Paenibacillus albidus TaxID=2041023 RepID=A0A917D0R8_9BACL|nr:hypothetical protein GCM10010912_56300 [Paenibacillus albidus]
MEGATDIQAVIKGGLYTADIQAAATDTSDIHLQTHAAEEADINIIRTATAVQADSCLNMLHESKAPFTFLAEGAFLCGDHRKLSYKTSASRTNKAVSG